MLSPNQRFTRHELAYLEGRLKHILKQRPDTGDLPRAFLGFDQGTPLGDVMEWFHQAHAAEKARSPQSIKVVLGSIMGAQYFNYQGDSVVLKDGCVLIDNNEIKELRGKHLVSIELPGVVENHGSGCLRLMVNGVRTILEPLCEISPKSEDKTTADNYLTSIR